MGMGIRFVDSIFSNMASSACESTMQKQELLLRTIQLIYGRSGYSS